MIMFVCMILNVFKAYFEAFTILFLFSNFRAVLFAEIRCFFFGKTKQRHNTVGVVRVTGTASVTQSPSSIRRGTY